MGYTSKSENWALIHPCWGGLTVRAFAREHLWTKSLVTSSLLIVFAGLLQKDPGLSPDSGMEEDRLFCCPNDSFHIPHWLEERGLYQADVLPAPPGLHLELWWYHGLCLLQSPSRYVWNLCWGGFTSRHADLCLEFRGQKPCVDFSGESVPCSFALLNLLKDNQQVIGNAVSNHS